MARYPRVDPTLQKQKYVNPDGTMTPQFLRQWELLLRLREAGEVDNATLLDLLTHQIVAGTGLTGGGPLSTPQIPIALANTAVTPATYGDATNVGQFTVDAQGRITAAANVPISGGGGVAWTLVDTHDFTASPVANWDVVLTGYSDAMFIGENITASIAGLRILRVSIDGGSTFSSTASDYQLLDTLGATTTPNSGMNLGNFSTTGARSSNANLRGINANGTPKQGDTNFGGYRLSPTSPIDAIRLLNTAGGNLNGGTAYVLAR